MIEDYGKVRFKLGDSR